MAKGNGISKLSELIPDKRNANKHSEYGMLQLEKGLRQNGLGRSILISSDNEIIAGNGVTETAGAIGIEDVQIVDSDGTKIIAVRRTDIKSGTKEFYQMALSDNIIAKENIILDAEIVDAICEEYEIEDWTSGEEKAEAVEDDFQIPDEIETDIVLGDLFEIGSHRLLCGDSTDSDAAARLMNGPKADMVFTDPPYDFDTEGGGILGKSQKMKAIKKLGINEFNPSVLSFDIAKTHVYFCNKSLIPEYIEVAKNWKQRWDLCFSHKTFAPANWGGHLQTDIEYILIIGRLAPNKGLEPKYYSKFFSGSKTDIDSKTGWAKPVALCDKFIQLYSSKSVYDPFLGSGSTMVAAHQLNRKCYGMEIDPKYCEVILQRMIKLDPTLEIKKNGQPYQP